MDLCRSLSLSWPGHVSLGEEYKTAVVGTAENQTGSNHEAHVQGIAVTLAADIAEEATGSGLACATMRHNARKAPVGKLAVKTSAESPKDLAPRHSISICFAGFLTSMSCTPHFTLCLKQSPMQMGDSAFGLVVSLHDRSMHVIAALIDQSLSECTYDGKSG